MKGNKGAIHSMKGQAGRSALLKLSGGNSGHLYCLFRGFISNDRKSRSSCDMSCVRG